ncbi:MAG TPA: nitroreductase family deazaflavin-dependent oxidoreductase [Ktedonobacteraceae bacterium]|jgi:deazaflavin-dependent oxidoreductase (nitroreductase family)|nr:nitroreductase family deazaflavin-dependent oxidoreductase [Ktedonobacteraceae bacterium]
MAKTDKAPAFVRVGNALTMTLMRAGVKMGSARYPMYLLTVRGRKSGEPRTLPIVILERDGMRYLNSPYGMVNWVRNLQVAGEAVLTRGGRSETVAARELPQGEAALVLQKEVRDGHPFARYIGVTANSSFEEFEHAVVTHPIFVLETK